MTNVERQILINQVFIMSALMNVLNSSKIGNKKDIEDLAKCVEMNYRLIADSK